jgi:hypothetical protein
MKWRMQQTLFKVAMIAGAIASFILAAGAEQKWG